MSTPPARRIADAQTLRALAHPARLALIDALVVHGSLTATEASELIGESPSNYSFHLRQLGRFGLIEPAPSTDARNRRWQVVAGGIGVDGDGLADAGFRERRDPAQRPLGSRPVRAYFSAYPAAGPAPSKGQ